MPGIEFSQAIIAGLRRRGLVDPEIARLAGISARGVETIAQGKRTLRRGELRRVELELDVTGGQLAASTVEPEGGPLTELMNTLASARSAAATRRDSKRSTARARPAR